MQSESECLNGSHGLALLYQSIQMGNALGPAPFTSFQHSSDSKFLNLPSNVTFLKVPSLVYIFSLFTQILLKMNSPHMFFWMFPLDYFEIYRTTGCEDIIHE